MATAPPDLAVRPDLRAAAAAVAAARASDPPLNRRVTFSPAAKTQLPKPRRGISFGAPPAADEPASEVAAPVAVAVGADEPVARDTDDEEEAPQRRRMPRTVTPHPKQIAAILARRATRAGADGAQSDDESESECESECDRENVSVEAAASDSDGCDGGCDDKSGAAES